MSESGHARKYSFTYHSRCIGTDEDAHISGTEPCHRPCPVVRGHGGIERSHDATKAFTLLARKVLLVGRQICAYLGVEIVDNFGASRDVVDIQVCLRNVNGFAEVGGNDEAEISIRIQGVLDGAYNERNIGAIVSFVDKPPLCIRLSEVEGAVDRANNARRQGSGHGDDRGTTGKESSKFS